MPKILSQLINQHKLEVTHFVNARLKIFMFSSEVYIPKDPYQKLDEGFETVAKHFSTKPPISPEDFEKLPDEAKKHIRDREADTLDRSIRRTKSVIKDIALCNKFEWFATFTFKRDRNDIDKCKQRMIGWLKRQKKASELFEYLIVPELHKDGESIHFHALIRGYNGKVVKAQNPKTGLELIKKGREVFDFQNYTLGHSEVYAIGGTPLDQIKTSFYLMKYIRKDMPIFANKRRYWSSKTLAKPVVIENPEEWYLMYFPDKVIEIANGKLLYFDNDRIEEHLGGFNG